MFYRKDAAVALAVCTMLASAGFAMAESSTETKAALTLDPSVVNLDDAAPRGLLMGGLDRINAGKTLDSLGLNIYGWVEGGYTYNHRHHAGSSISPGPFNHEVGNHFMGNQLDLRVERLVDLKKWDVGGLIEVLYGTDSNAIHSNGLEYGNSGFEDRYHPMYQFDIPQAYIDVAIPVGNGLKVRAGKFVTIASLETIAPTTNAFYSHSYVFNAVPFTHTGIIGFYNLNDQWSFALGISRGWDQATEDNNGAIDVLGQVTYNFSKTLIFNLNLIVGPEDNRDTSHYRTLINPTVTWQATDKLSFGADVLYVADGAFNQTNIEFAQEQQFFMTRGGYGDAWGAALYAGYAINDMFTLNGRVEKFHDFRSGVSRNFYEVTLGVTIKPMPKDPIGSNLKLRPEIRYDYSEDKVFSAGDRSFKDQLTFGADVIFTF